MATANIGVRQPEDVRSLFGPQDRYLRRIREATGLKVLLRGDELVLEGSPEQLEEGQGTIRRLLEIVENGKELSDETLEKVLQYGRPASTGEGAIELREKGKTVIPRTPGQREYVEAIRKHDLVFCRGPAGSGKTYLAVAMALQGLRQQRVKKIVLVRPAVEAGEKLGFLPGDLLAKVNPFLRPLLDAMHDLLDYDQVRRYMEADIVEIVPLAFMRGRTLNQTYIILDEAQNTTVTQMKMLLTRMGEGSHIVVTGDATQTDLPPNVTSGFDDAILRLSKIEGVACVELTGRDIVRHRLVREIVDAYDDQATAGRHRVR